MRLIYLLFILVSLTTASVNIRPIKAKSGIYYEPIDIVRIPKNNWQITSSLDLNIMTFYAAELVNASVLPAVKNNCQQYFNTVNQCQSIAKNYVSNIKLKFIDLFVQHLKTIPYSYQDDPLQRPSRFHVQSNYHKLQTQLHLVMMKFRRNNISLWQEIEDFTNSTRNKSMLEENTTTKDNMYLDKIQEIVNNYKTAVDGYIYHIRIIRDALRFANEGIIHSTLLPLDELNQEIKKFHQNNLQYTVPISEDQFTMTELSRISTISYGLYGEQLIFVIEVPVLDSDDSEYYLYEVHTYPVPQQLGRVTGSVLIQTKGRYLLFSNNYEYYSLVNDMSDERCLKLDSYTMCKPLSVFMKTEMVPQCEVVLFNPTNRITSDTYVFPYADGDDTHPYAKCILKITKEFDPYWQRLTSSGWLFSTSNSDELQVSCISSGNNVEAMQISDVGILNMPSGCKAETLSVTVIEAQELENNNHDMQAKIPNVELNLSAILASMKDDVLIFKNYPNVIISSSMGNIVVSYDTLKDLQEELVEIKKRNTSEEYQDDILLWIIFSMVMLGLIIMFYVLKNYVCHNIIHMMKYSRQKDKKGSSS